MPYTTRTSLVTARETFDFEGDELVVRREDGGATRVPVADLTQVWLAYQPTRDESERYTCRLVTRRGVRLEFTNREYKGVLDFERRDAEYAAFVREVHARLASRTDVTFRGGVGALRHAAGAGCLVGGIVLVLLGIAVMLAAMGLVLIAVLKFVLIATMVPGALRWVARNQPRTYDPRAIPPELLPAAGR